MEKGKSPEALKIVGDSSSSSYSSSPSSSSSSAESSFRELDDVFLQVFCFFPSLSIFKKMYFCLFMCAFARCIDWMMKF